MHPPLENLRWRASDVIRDSWVLCGRRSVRAQFTTDVADVRWSEKDGCFIGYIYRRGTRRFLAANTLDEAKAELLALYRMEV